MAELDDLLKVMTRIERILQNSSPSTGGGRGRSAPTVAGGRRQDRQDQNENRRFRARSVGLESLEAAAGGAAKSLNGLSKTVQNTRANFVAMNRSMRATTRGAPTANVTGGLQTAGGANGALPPAAVQSLMRSVFGRGGAGRGGPVQQSLANLASGVSIGGVAVVSALKELSTAIKPIINDFFMLHANGVNAEQAMAGLYWDAIRAGMSLQEYTKLLHESGPVVARSASFDDFYKMLGTTSTKLADFGIFGADASKLSGAMMTSATTLGIARNQIGTAVDGQISVFKRLGQSTMLTAETMQELTDSLADNDNVQGQLLGLNQSERAARLAELTQTQALGITMGMTKKASKALGDALIEQRKLTAVERFNAAGTIRQAGAITGMGAGDAETLAMLGRKKNRTAEEDALFTQLGGELQRRIEVMQNSGNPALEHIADTLSTNLGPISNQLKQAALGRLATDAGPVEAVNRDFKTGTSDLVKGAGEWLSIAQGLSKNPIATAITGAVGSSAFAFALGAAITGALGPLLTRLLGRATGLASGAIGAGAAGVGGAAAAAGAGAEAAAATTATSRTSALLGILGKSLGMLGIVIPGITNLIDSTTDYTKANEALMAGQVGADKARGEAIGQGIGGTIGTALGVAISGFFGLLTGGMGLLATGLITSITTGIGAWAGKLIGGWAKSDKATEAQTKETKKNTDELKKANAVKVDQATEILSGTDNLTGTLMRSARVLNDQAKADAATAIARADEAAKTNIAAAEKIKSAPIDTVLSTKELAQIRKDARDQVYDGRNPNANEGDVNNRMKELIAETRERKLRELQATPVAPSNAAIATAAQAGAEAAQAVIATPGPTPRPAVTPPAVNTPTDTPATTPAAATTATGSTAAITTPDLTTTLATIISLLQQSVDAEKLQATLAEAMWRSSGRPQFGDATVTLDNAVRYS